MEIKSDLFTEALVDEAIEASKLAKLSIVTRLESVFSDEPSALCGGICLAAVGIFADSLDAALRQAHPGARKELATLIVDAYDAIVVKRMEEIRRIANGGKQ